MVLHNIFYSSYGDSLKYYDGTNWNFLLYDPVTYHNAGGSGSYVYYMAYSLPPSISRFTGTALNTIMVDSNLVFTVADIGVSTFGTIYYFAGAGATTQFMYEISSTGNLLNTYPMNLNTAGGYGCFVMNNTIYIGIGPGGSPANSLIPITISGSNAIVGSPLSMPALNFKDLASCTGEVTNISQLHVNEENFSIYPNPAKDVIKLNYTEPNSFRFELYDVTGSILISKNSLNSGEEISIGQLVSGIYFIRIQTSDKVYYRTIHKI